MRPSRAARGHLAELTPVEGRGLTDALELLERHALIRGIDHPRDPRGGYAFTHDVMQRVVYAEVSGPRRRLMHARVAAALDALEDVDGTLAAEVAHHATLAGDPALAARACVRAGRRCLAVFANAEAESLARRGLRAAAELHGGERTHHEIELLEVSLAAKRPGPGDAVGMRLESLARAALDEGALEHARLAFHLLAYLRWEAGDWGDAERQMREAELVGRSTDPGERAVALAEAARCLVMLERDLPDAEALLLEATALAERTGTEISALADATGMLRQHAGAVDEAARLFETARALARRAGDRRGEFQILEHRLGLELERGDIDRARAVALELVHLAERLGDGSEAPFARALEALTRSAMEHRADGTGRAAPHGDAASEHGHDDARRDLDRALAELAAADAKHRLAYVQRGASALELAHGDAARAHEHAVASLEAALVMGRPTEIAAARLAVTRSAAARGDRDRLERERAALAELSARFGTRLAAHVRRQIETTLAARAEA